MNMQTQQWIKKGWIIGLIALVSSAGLTSKCRGQQHPFTYQSAALTALQPQEKWPDMTADPLPNRAEEQDSLMYKRGVITGKMQQKGRDVNIKALEGLLKEHPKALKKYRWGSYLRPLGPLVSAGGVALCYIAIKGKPASATVEGQTYPYTIRNLPMLIAGIGAFAGGICIVEFSHELQSRAADIYNSGLNKKKTSLLQNTKFGITPNGNIGLYARF